jgi:flagellar biosynthesis chaperone FliJ
LINEWLLAFGEIEKDLNIIKQKESILTVQSSDSELTMDRKEQILEDIRYINALLESNKKKIASLNAQLKKSGSSMKGLETKIASLEASVKKYENEISDLKIVLINKDFEIGQLNNKMTDLEMALLMQEEKINSQTEIIKQAYLTYGTAKDLEEKGIILKEGGFLGLGKTELLTSDFEDSLFTKINVDETRTIPVNSKNVRLITEHPSSSYELVQENEDQIAYIEIKDPEQFWKISKYAVVELKNK